jgi:hypothetical protein
VGNVPGDFVFVLFPFRFMQLQWYVVSKLEGVFGLNVPCTIIRC